MHAHGALGGLSAEYRLGPAGGLDGSCTDARVADPTKARNGPVRRVMIAWRSHGVHLAVSTAGLLTRSAHPVKARIASRTTPPFCSTLRKPRLTWLLRGGR